MPLLHSPVQRSLLLLAHNVHVGILLQQGFHHSTMAPSRCVDQVRVPVAVLQVWVKKAGLN